MNILACVKCQAQYLPKKLGVTVIETSGTPPKPVRLWIADLMACPICNAELITRFAHEPSIEITELGFADFVERAHRENKERVYTVYVPSVLDGTVTYETVEVAPYRAKES